MCAALDSRWVRFHSQLNRRGACRPKGPMAESSAVARGRPVEPAPGNAGGGMFTSPHFPGTKTMIATKDSFEPSLAELLPNSRRIYVTGKLHADVRVPLREITLSPTKSIGGRAEVNEPVRVYDCSGPWGDPDFAGDVNNGLPALRREWILRRGDVREYEPLSKAGTPAVGPDPSGLRRRPLRASAGHPVTQLWYARQGIVTPEMEYIAIRENMGRAKIAELSQDIVRNDLHKQHTGSAQLQNEYTPGIFRRFPQRIPAQ